MGELAGIGDQTSPECRILLGLFLRTLSARGTVLLVGWLAPATRKMDGWMDGWMDQVVLLLMARTGCDKRNEHGYEVRVGR
jgi:hypothetical protein